ncbi:MAG: DeoR/GlpR family DNA-binding transcription regulator [Octadecabacter sp.]|nr:DeoR/GlpR family DNA-binding transcription regulator [Octadecabacter sp.]
MSEKKTRRQARILDALGAKPTIRVNVLADDLGVSAETVRRDLAELDKTGLIQRTYGGAVKASLFEPALAERLKIKVKERERIANHAIILLENADCIFVGGGATTLHFARALRSIERRITVLTASFSVAIELSTNPLIKVMSLPGIVEPKEGLMCGADTLRFISQYRPRIAVMGASAIDAAGVSEAMLNAAQVYKAMIENSERAIIMADSSKFGLRALQIVAEWGPNKILITDQHPDKELHTAIETSGCDIQVVLV